jgi:hypothetical protein
MRARGDHVGRCVSLRLALIVTLSPHVCPEPRGLRQHAAVPGRPLTLSVILPLLFLSRLTALHQVMLGSEAIVMFGVRTFAAGQVRVFEP